MLQRRPPDVQHDDRNVRATLTEADWGEGASLLLPTRSAAQSIRSDDLTQEVAAMGLSNGIHHLAIATRDITAQVEFFTQVCGMELVALYWMHGLENTCMRS